MPNTKITNLTPAGDPAQSGDELPINRGGLDGKVTAGSIAALGGGGGGGSQSPWTSNIDANGFTLGFDTGTGIVDFDTQDYFLKFNQTASAVNYLTIANAAIGNSPTITFTGIGPEIVAGAGVPSLTAPMGSLFLRSDGGPYVNTTGTTGWSSVAFIASGSTPPPFPLAGQIWLNTSNNSFNYYGIASWSPSNLTFTTLSNNNLTATATSGPGTAFAVALSTTPATAVFKATFRITVTLTTGGSYLGVCNSSYTPINAALLGHDANLSVGFSSAGVYFINSVSTPSGVPWGSGDIVDVAVDRAASLIWIRANSGNWNGSGTANPATGAGGINISAVVGNLSPVVTHGNAGDNVTANFAPGLGISGFTDWIGYLLLNVQSPWLSPIDANGFNLTFHDGDGIQWPPDLGGNQKKLFTFASNLFWSGGNKTTTTTSAFNANIGIGGGAGAHLTTGSENVFIGTGAGQNVTTAVQNVCIGSQAGGSLDTGSTNFALGRASLTSVTDGPDNVAIGVEALENIATGFPASNTAIGRNAGKNIVNGRSNTLIGAYSGVATYPCTTFNNVFVGYLAGNAISSYPNVMIGASCGSNVTSGIANTLLGSSNLNGVGATLTTGSNNILIGDSVDVPSASTSNYLNIGGILTGNVSTGTIAIGLGAVATNATGGFLYIPTCAGTPTGVPTTVTGRVAMVYDTSNNKFYIYNGAWKGGTNPGVFT